MVDRAKRGSGLVRSKSPELCRFVAAASWHGVCFLNVGERCEGEDDATPIHHSLLLA